MDVLGGNGARAPVHGGGGGVLLMADDDKMSIPAYEQWPEVSEQELVEAAYEMTGGNLQDLPSGKIARLLTIVTFVGDLCLNEIERRGLLHVEPDGTPVVPYLSEHGVTTILTRDQP